MVAPCTGTCPTVRIRQWDDEAPVEEAVGTLARGLRDHGAAMTGGAVEEVLGILGDSPGTDRVRGAAGHSVQSLVEDVGQAVDDGAAVGCRGRGPGSFVEGGAGGFDGAAGVSTLAFADSDDVRSIGRAEDISGFV